MNSIESLSNNLDDQPNNETNYQLTSTEQNAVDDIVRMFKEKIQKQPEIVDNKAALGDAIVAALGFYLGIPGYFYNLSASDSEERPTPEQKIRLEELRDMVMNTLESAS